MNEDVASLHKIDILKKVPIFSEISSKDLEKIVAVTHHRKYRKDNMILIEEEAGQTMFILMSGQVKISRISEDGREVILAVMGAGEFFGELSLLDGQSRSANVTVIKDAEMLLINRDDFLNLLNEFPRIAIQLLRELASRMRKSDSQIKSLSLKNATGKVTGTIHRLAEDIGVRADNRVHIENLPTQQDLANMAGTSRETISRVLQKLANDKYITRDGSKLIITDYERFKKDFI
ncbi:Crp/Fnr family transcriptional regulator [bacterium]|nr:Crp/Fnr family transcriptional regulator [bacterium]